MKTSVIEVHAMLSVLSVDEVEKRIGEVPGVGSVTVNHAAGSATVRYDETRLEIADIRSAVRQSGYESAAPADASAGKSHDDSPSTAQAGKAATIAAALTPGAAAPKPSPIAPTPAVPRPTAAAGEKPQDKTASDKS